MSGVTSSGYNVTSAAGAGRVTWGWGEGGVCVAAGVLAGVGVSGLGLNAVLVWVLHASPCLRTPPNAHLVNVSLAAMAAALSALLALPTLLMPALPGRRRQVLSGLQLFLTMHCLLQYWGALVSIAVYRWRTARPPGLSLRGRKLLVSRSIAVAWVVSLLLALTFSLTAVHDAPYLPLTLDPFRAGYLLAVPQARDVTGTLGTAERGQPHVSEQVVVMSLVVAMLVAGLLMIVTSYYSLCRALHVTLRVGKVRVSPCAPPPGPLLTDPPGSGTSGGRPYKVDSSNHRLFCISGSDPYTDLCTVRYIPHLPTSHTPSDVIAIGNAVHPLSGPTSRDPPPAKRPLVSTLSPGSGTSGRCTEFTDISLGQEGGRLQRAGRRSACREASRRERGPLSAASKNSLAMLTVFLTCCTPLIVSLVPGSLRHVTAQQRLLVVMVCRLLFLLNSPVYPLWYLLFSVRVKKSLRKMCESCLGRFSYRQR